MDAWSCRVPSFGYVLDFKSRSISLLQQLQRGIGNQGGGAEAEVEEETQASARRRGLGVELVGVQCTITPSRATK